jgi:thymidylate synthase
MNKISKADIYFRQVIDEIIDEGQWDKNPRPKYKDGTPAHSKFITQQSFDYRIDKGELPLISLRRTAIKGGWHDIEAIYQKQTNIIEEMQPSINSWWEDFVVSVDLKGNRSIGQTYGHTVKRYNLVNNLIDGIINNPFGRRHIINLWQTQQQEEDPAALVPCAYETLWSVSEVENERVIDLTLNQRSQDFLMTASINPMQYVMFGMAICGHLTFTTGIKHSLRKFKHNIQNVHIYDRHIFAISELKNRVPSSLVASVKLEVYKNFYDYKFEDFDIYIPFTIVNLSGPLELAV